MFRVQTSPLPPGLEGELGRRQDLLGTLIWAAVLLWLGDWDLLWPVILIAIGASILLRGFFRELELQLLK